MRLTKTITSSMVLIALSFPFMQNCTWAGQQSKTWEEERTQASFEAKPKEDYVEALTHLRKALKLANNDKSVSPKIRYEMYGQMVSYARKLNSPQVYYEALKGKLSTATEGKNTQLVEDNLIQLANIEYELKKYDEALEHVKTVIPSVSRTRGENFPGLIRAYQLLGTCYFKKGNYSKAKEFLLKSLEMSEKTVSKNYPGSIGLSHAYLGLIAEKGDKLKEAKGRFEKAQAKVDSMKREKRKLSELDRELMRFPIPEALARLSKGS